MRAIKGFVSARIRFPSSRLVEFAFEGLGMSGRIGVVKFAPICSAPRACSFVHQGRCSGQGKLSAQKPEWTPSLGPALQIERRLGVTTYSAIIPAVGPCLRSLASLILQRRKPDTPS